MKILILSIALLISSLAYSQDVDTVLVRPFYQDTLTVTIDTVDITLPNAAGINRYVLYVKNSSNSDTIQVFTKTGGLWGEHGAQDLLLGTSGIIVSTTTAKEFLILDTEPQRIRLIRPSDDTETCIFVLAGKTTHYPR